MQNGKSRNFGFVVYKHKCSVKYAIELFRDTKLFGKPISPQNRALEEAERQSLRNRRQQSLNWRKDEVSALRGGSLSVFSRLSTENMVGGAYPEFSRDDDINALRGGTAGLSRKNGNMTPTYSSHSSPQNKYDNLSPNMDPRYSNPYSSILSSSQPSDLRDTHLSFGRYASRVPESRYDRHSLNERDHLKFGRDGSRHGRDYDRKPERDRDGNRHRRSRSRDRSPHKNNKHRRR